MGKAADKAALAGRPLAINSPPTLIAIISAALVALGLVMVYSASGARAGLEQRRAVAASTGVPAESIGFHHSRFYLERQMVWVFAGLVAMVVLMRMPIDRIERWSPAALAVCLVLLLLVLLTPLGVTAKGARRWLSVGPITIQPSEFAKIAIVLFMARYLSIKRGDIRDWKRGFLPAVGVVGVFAALIVLERDLGAAVIIGAVVFGMWCLARVRMTHLAALALMAVPAVVYLVFQQSYRIARILALLDPEKYALTSGFQLNQSLIAVGSGGLFGRGLGQSLQKHHFLSEAHTDFIFAIVCEEIGLLGAGSVVLLFVALALVGFRVSYRAPDYFGGQAAAGLTMVIVTAAFVNFFVVLGMAPTKGLALPFFTYGGSSMLASLMAIGILLNVANYTAESRGGT